MEQRFFAAWQTSSPLNSVWVESNGRRLLLARSDVIGGGIRRLAIKSTSGGAGAPQSGGVPTGSSTPDSPATGGFQSLDPDVVIIMVVLFFALICAVLVNSLMRCAMRRRAQLSINTRAMFIGRGDGPGDLDSSEQGLDANTLASLPVLTFKSSESSKPAEVDCTICLCEFTENERLRLLPKCSHVFHLDCIDLWLLSHNSCPVCRDGIKGDAESALKLDHDSDSEEMMVLTLDQDGQPSVVRRSTSMRAAGGAAESGESALNVRVELKRDKSWSMLSDAARLSSSRRSLSLDHSRQASFRDGSMSGRVLGSSSRSSFRAAISAILTTSGGTSSSARWPGSSSSFRAGPAAAPAASAMSESTTERPEDAGGSLVANEQPRARSESTTERPEVASGSLVANELPQREAVPAIGS